MSRADEEIALIESLRKRGKSQSAAAKEAAAAMKAKDISEAEAYCLSRPNTPVIFANYDQQVFAAGIPYVGSSC